MPPHASRTSILLIEPDAAARAILHTAASTFAHVESHAGFETARARLGRAPFDFLVTNIRLNAYNGLHLVYLLEPGPGAIRAIAYGNEHDVGLAQDVQRAGAFYEVGRYLPITLRAYLAGTLPARDRRDPASRDRRGVFRGGQRCWDLHLARPRP